MKPDFSALVRLLDARLAEAADHPDPETAAEIAFLRGVLAEAAADVEAAGAAPSTLPVVAESLAGGPTVRDADRALGDWITAHNGMFQWVDDWHGTWPEGQGGREAFSANYAYTRLLGEHALGVTRHVQSGLMTMGPGLIYPSHAHPAVELYIILKGTSWWSIGDGPWQVRRPGDVFLHPSWVAHATHTMDEPILTAYFWSGDTSGPSAMTGRSLPSPHDSTPQ